VVRRGRTGTVVRERPRSDSYGNNLWNLKHRIEHFAGGLWRRTQPLLRGRFLPPTTCFAILSGLFCLRPVCTLVREGGRNLVVILWKLKMLFCKSVPADETSCQCFRAPMAPLMISLFWCSVHEPAHANVHHNPQGQEHEEY
jgi:hypothetical protein